VTRSRDRSDLARWLICGAIVVGFHLGAAAVFANWGEAGDPGQSDVFAVELTPLPAAPRAAQPDLAVAPRLQQPEPEPEKIETPDKPIEQPPQPVKAEIPLPKPDEPKQKPKPKQVAVATSPKPSDKLDDKMATPALGNAAQRKEEPKWGSLVSAHLRAFTQYPAGARAHGVAVVTFSIDRNGRVLSASLARSSGVAALDHEVVAMVHRANPFPPAPPGATENSFTVPVNFR
jgi:protein TonB